MLNFTVGPVQSFDEILEIGSQQVPYFRTKEFSQVMFENEKIFLELINAPQDAKAVFITGSGTASMEAVIINCLNKKDKCLLVNGGSFGERFKSLLTIHDISYDEISVEVGRKLTKEHLKQYEEKDYTAFLVNLHETSVGNLYDIDIISDFCRKKNITLIVDAISCFLADEIDMARKNIDVIITGSQKAIACPPGISMIALSPRMIEKMNHINPKCMYLNLKEALKDGERGQTPFTPAVSILLQINARLKEIKNNGGAESEIVRVRELAEDFRNRIKGLPFEIASESLSNAVTPLRPLTASANTIFEILKDEYGIWICPNGGSLKDELFRVGHIGNLTKDDNTVLINAFKELERRGII